MRKHLKYLAYVLRHKRYVYQAGRELGVGRIQLLIHDWSKFLPSEWLPYARFFYGGHLLPPGMRQGYYVVGKVQRDFDVAWLKHQHRNPHHWQWHILREDSGETKVLPMPDKYRREMVADWRGAGRAIHGKDETASWYEATRAGRMLHPETQAWVEAQLKGAGGAPD